MIVTSFISEHDDEDPIANLVGVVEAALVCLLVVLFALFQLDSAEFIPVNNDLLAEEHVDAKC